MDLDSNSLSASRLHNSHDPRCCSVAGDLSVRRVKSETGFPSYPGNSPTGSVTATLVSVGAYLGGSIIYYTRPRGVYCRDWRSEGGHRIFVARYGLALVGDIACSGFACCHSRYPIGKALEPIMNVSGSMAS